jgi:hypothetical protein
MNTSRLGSVGMLGTVVAALGVALCVMTGLAVGHTATTELEANAESAAALQPAADRAAPPIADPQVFRFVAVDVVVETDGTPLAAYQIQVLATDLQAKLTGVEGGDKTVNGEPGVFAEPPKYDPAALAGTAGRGEEAGAPQHGDRVIIAALSTRPAAELPRGAVRVARLHWMLPSRVNINTLKATVMAAADSQAERINVKVKLVEVATGGDR